MIPAAQPSPTSLHTRMRFMILASSTVALVLASGAFLLHDHYSSRHTMEERIRVLTDLLAPQAAPALQRRDRRAAAEILGRLSATPRIISAALFVDDGPPFARYLRADAPEEALPARPGQDGLRRDRADLVLVRPAYADGARMGTIFLRLDMGEAADRLHLNLIIVGLTLLVLLVASYFLSARLVATISRPLTTLSQVVKSVTSRRDFSIRARKEGPEELAILIDGINDMLSQIQVRDGALTLARNEMENRIQERTAELTFVNQELSSEIAERKRIDASLRESEERYRQLVEFSPDGILILGGERILFVNGAALRMFGARTQGDLVGTSLMERVAPDFQERVQLRLREVTEEHRGTPPLEPDLIRMDGSLVDAEIQETPFIYQGRPAVQVVIRDISKRKEIERMKDEFVSTVSHELRTPLTSIQGSLGLVANGVTGALPAGAKPLVDIAYKNCGRLILLINDILDSEKIAAGKMKFHLVEQDLKTLLEHAVESNRAFGAQFNVRIEVGEAVPGAKVDVDTDRMIQVLTNLISNAVKFSPKGDVVTVSARRADGRLKVAVSDHGEGIPAEFRDRIFQKFSQADSSDRRTKGGTGLGLSISKAIVEQHQGTLSFVSEEGKGTTFFVDLPERTPAGGTRSAAPHALVCEDEPAVADLLRTVLERENIRVSVVHTLTEARESLGSGGIDLLTLDLQLPDGNGLEFIRELRQSPARTGLPILLVSPLAPTPSDLDGRALGRVEFLEKPINLAKLAAAARTAVAGSRRALKGA